MTLSTKSIRAVQTFSWHHWARRRDSRGYSAIMIVYRFQSELTWVHLSIFKQARSGELHRLCENSASSGCGVSRRNLTFGDVTGTTARCCSGCCSPTCCRLPSGRGGLRIKYDRRGEKLVVTTRTCSQQSIIVSLSGPATARNVNKVIPVLSEAIATKKHITLDFSNTRSIDARFLGLLLMLNKKLKSAGATSVYAGLSAELKKIFRLNGLDFKPSIEE